jgi:phospholipid/cholesterol/gamma-HCH transport system substrate-binding protein
VLKQLADENVTLKNLASESDRALAPLARDRRHLSGFIKNANEVGEATAAQSADLQRGIQKLPRFLRELKPTLEDLGQLSDEMTPTLADLDRASPSLTRLVLQLGPFSQSATRSLVSLGKTTDVGGPVLKRALPVVKDLKAFAHNAKPVSKNLDALTASLDRTGGLEHAMNYIFFQMTAINGFDEISHYLRASLLVNVCSAYVTAPVPGCSATFTQTKSISSSAAATKPAAATASKAVADTPVTALGKVAKGLLQMGSSSPTDSQLKATAKQNVERVQKAAAKDASPALDNVGSGGGTDKALLSYLMGSG